MIFIVALLLVLLFIYKPVKLIFLYSVYNYVFICCFGNVLQPSLDRWFLLLPADDVFLNINSCKSKEKFFKIVIFLFRVINL